MPIYGYCRSNLIIIEPSTLLCHKMASAVFAFAFIFLLVVMLYSCDLISILTGAIGFLMCCKLGLHCHFRASFLFLLKFLFLPLFSYFLLSYDVHWIMKSLNCFSKIF